MSTCSDVDLGFDLDVWWEGRVVQKAERAGGWFYAVAIGEVLGAFHRGVDLPKLVGDEIRVYQNKLRGRWRTDREFCS